MSNQAEIDYEKQFQEDLAKATALSLEQQALEEFKRGQKYGLPYTQSVQQEAKNRNYAQLRRQHYARRDSTETSASTTHYGLSLPPPQSNQPQRRHSEITSHHNKPPPTNLLTDIERSKTPPLAAAAENDLINFASPTSTKPENTTFEKLIEDLQKLHPTNPQTALVPLAPTAAAAAASASAAPMYAGYHTPAASALYAATAAASMQQPVQYGMTAAGMQLVPFTPPPPQQKVPLTHDELQKLYSMSQSPYTAPLYGPRPMGFMPGIQGAAYYRQTPPVMMPAAGAPLSAPVQYPNPFGFHYNMTVPTASQLHYYAPNLAAPGNVNNASTATSSLASNVYNLNSNPQQTVNTNLASVHNNNFTQTYAQPSTASQTSSQQQINGQNNFRRHTPPARKPKATGSDLIDLSHEDDSRVSVLEAFDPLLNENDYVTKRLNK